LNLAEQLKNHHLEVRIRIWLAPLLPPEEARRSLNSAYSLAKKDGLQGLLNEIIELEQSLDHPV
jgi:hypothetical protein